MNRVRAVQAFSRLFCQRRLFTSESKVFGRWNPTNPKSTKSSTSLSEKKEVKSDAKISRPRSWKLTSVSNKVPRGWKERKRSLPDWLVQKYAVAEKINQQVWRPQKRLSPDTVDGIRIFKHDHPDVTNDILADRFKVSAEAIRRIVKSKWKPTEEEKNKMRERWARRTNRRVQSLKNEDGIESRADRVIKRAERYETIDGCPPADNPNLQDEQVLTNLIAQEEAYRRMMAIKNKNHRRAPKVEISPAPYREKRSETSKLRRQLQKLGSMEDNLRRKTDGQQHQAIASLWSQKF